MAFVCNRDHTVENRPLTLIRGGRWDGSVSGSATKENGGETVTIPGAEI